MTPSEQFAYERAARLIARGHSGNKAMKETVDRRNGPCWDAARQGVKDMKTFMRMLEIYNSEKGPS